VREAELGAGDLSRYSSYDKGRSFERPFDVKTITLSLLMLKNYLESIFLLGDGMTAGTISDVGGQSVQ
jgi:hypothetical protein